MIEPMAWTDRTWTFTLPAGVFPTLLERLRGTPVRAAALVGGVSDQILSTRADDRWSSKEHVAHLDDLHELDDKRLDEFLAGAAVLSAADMTNQTTHTANHNARAVGDILDRLRLHREALVRRMDSLSMEDVVRSCTHPRLQVRIRLIDWAYFVAEHDDHHLVRARRAIPISAPDDRVRAARGDH